MINYLEGDATAPIGEGKKVICHICNDVGKWGSGFVIAISKRWKHVEHMYLDWSRGGMATPPFKLGNVMFCLADEGDIVIANMIAQHKIQSMLPVGEVPIRYEALRDCMKKVNTVLHKEGEIMSPDFKPMTLHMPRIGCERAGGTWDEVEKIINTTIDKDVDVFVYDFKP